MITFNCPGCQTELTVPEEKMGIKGKCPKCKTIVEVPKYSVDTPIFDEAEMKFKNHLFQELYKYLLNNSAVPLKRHRVDEVLGGDNLELVVETGAYKERTQKVSVYLTEVATSTEEVGTVDGCICMNSSVGTLLPDASHLILHAAYWKPFCRLIAKENILMVACEKELESCSREEFSRLVYLVAVHADQLEKAMFDWDIA